MSTELGREGQKDLCRKLDAVGWGVFFVWMGIIMLVKILPAGVGSIGIGAIILGEAVARFLLKVSISAFWVLMGAIFILAGIGELWAINLPLLPIAFIIVGALLIFRQTTKTNK